MRILLVLVLVSGSAYVSLDPPPDMVLTDVFGSSEADLHCYRRPALLLTSGGTLLAFAERERQENGTCWQFGAAVSVVVRRSQDGGATWSTPEVVIAGSSDDTVGNPTPLEDTKNGKLLLLVSKNSHSVLLQESGDEGETWDASVDITDMIARLQGSTLSPGTPGGIQLPSGRLIVGLYGQGSYSIYSDDSGKTWNRSTLIGENVNGDCQVAAFYKEAEDLIMVAQGPFNKYLAYSNDSGEQWYNLTSPSSLSPQSNSGASILAVPYTGVYRDTHLYITQPSSFRPQNLTLFHSVDGGVTWKADFQLWDGPSARSSLAHDENYLKIFCLFECGKLNETEKISLAIFSALI